MRSVMRHQFSQVPRAEIQRSSFDRSHGFKTTFDGGYLVPVFVDEALPGDTFSLSMTSFARMSTPLHPIMDNLYCDAFFFFVPNRLLWTHWENLMGQQDNPGDSTSYLVPTVTSNWPVGSLGDYFGLPITTTCTANALHFRAYNFIYNEWFRDQNLQNSVVVSTGDGPDSAANYLLLRRGKRHDYFTSALPWPQKGTAVTIPIGTAAPVKGGNFYGASGPDIANRAFVLDVTPANARYAFTVQTTTGNLTANTVPGVAQNTFWPVGTSTASTTGLWTDLSVATATTINALRQAFQIQRIYERDARGGTRYTEMILAHFGVSSPDARLQRPEYLGGGSTPININPLAQTSATGLTGATTPLGNLSGIGTFSHSGVGFSKSFTEHGVIMGFVSVRADLTYQNSLNRMWSRQTRFDFYWPALAHIGEQSVLNKEIYFQGTSADDLTFGYQERYAEYRYKPSLITGVFRSQAAGTLDSWHLAQNFGALPTLNSSFIQDTPPISRVVAVTTQPQFLFDAYFRLHCARPMPVFGVPGLIDHF